MSYPSLRPRRLRRLKSIRELVAETTLRVEDLILPVFVDESIKKPIEISSMPGIYRHTIHSLVEHLNGALEKGLKGILVFGVPKRKDDVGSSAYHKSGIVQRSVRTVKREFGEEILVYTDLCLCGYTSHGHCGILKKNTGKCESWSIDNDETLKTYGKIAVSQAEAGADFIAPSGMMDGMVAAIREALDSEGYTDVGIMSYSVKYASSFYGPFREAAHSAPRFGDRRSYQMDPRNAYEALKEALLDLEEGADIIMVKPALPYLDVIRLVKSNIPYIPLAAYNVSGEYSMVKSASSKGFLDEKLVTWEILHSIKRAGADLIITYHALEAASWIREGFSPF